jgi:hypothetical protein
MADPNHMGVDHQRHHHPRHRDHTLCHLVCGDCGGCAKDHVEKSMLDTRGHSWQAFSNLLAAQLPLLLWYSVALHAGGTGGVFYAGTVVRRDRLAAGDRDGFGTRSGHSKVLSRLVQYTGAPVERAPVRAARLIRSLRPLRANALTRFSWLPARSSVVRAGARNLTMDQSASARCFVSRASTSTAR